MNTELKDWFNNTPHDMGKKEFDSLNAIVEKQLQTQLKEANEKVALYRTLYEAVNEMMAQLGCYGEIDTNHPLSDKVMSALHVIDGGNLSGRP